MRAYVRCVEPGRVSKRSRVMDYHQLHQSRLRRRRDPDQIPQPLSLIGLELTELIAPGILTRWIGNSSLLGVEICVTLTELDRYAAMLSQVSDVTSVSSPGGTFINGVLVGPPSAATELKDGSAFITIGSTAPLFSQASEAQLDRLHSVATPGGRDVQLTDRAQINRDSSEAVTSRLPIVLSFIAAITFVLLFLLTGSVVLPLKALLLNVLSLTASFGALVWVFQNGHLGAFGTTATGTLVANIPVLLFCIAFGLSMDYEVFLVSRIRESWLASGRARADSNEAVALGLARSGRVVTAAALLMSISFAALIAAQVSFMKMFGVGLTLAVLVDATLVRMLLMPAFMRVLGRANWWAPAPLERLL